MAVVPIVTSVLGASEDSKQPQGGGGLVANDTNTKRTAEEDVSTSDALGYVESGIGMAGDLTNLIMPWMSMGSQGLQMQQQQKNFDKTFEENKRRFGLELALKEWSLRKGFEIREAEMLWNKKISSESSQINRALARESLQDSAQNRQFNAEKMAWIKEDREKAKKVSEAYSKGLLKGLGGK